MAGLAWIIVMTAAAHGLDALGVPWWIFIGPPIGLASLWLADL